MTYRHSKIGVVALTMLASLSIVLALALVIGGPIVGLGVVLGILH